MALSQELLVHYENISIAQAGHDILSDVGLKVVGGDLVFLVGKTGQGKSSLLKTIYADLLLKQQSSGAKAQVVGQDLLKITSGQIPALRRQLGIVFQDFQLFYDRTVNDNLLFVLKATGWTDKTKMQNRIAEVLMLVGLGAVGNKMPHQLSGGEQQRVVIARALLNDPKLLIADEPTGNLDPDASLEILKIFAQLAKKGKAILMATHNLQLLKAHPARLYEVYNGKVYERDPANFSSLTY